MVVQLTNSRACVVQSSTLLFAVSIVVAVYTGARAPSTRREKNVSFIWRLVPHRDILVQPPFFFNEVRLTLLSISLLYCVGRLIYEAVVGDVFVVLVVARLCATAYMLRDQWWLCRNWKPFFVEHTLRPWLWQRLFLALGAQFCAVSLDVMTDSDWAYFALHILSGVAVVVCYMWGKHWDWRRNDLDDDRRIRAIAYLSLMLAAIFLARMIYDVTVPNGYYSYNGSLTCAAAYFLVGVVIYAIDRRQQRLKATINQRQSKLDTTSRQPAHPLIGLTVNNRVASGLDDEASSDKKCDDGNDANGTGRSLTTVTPFVVEEGTTTLTTADTPMPAATSAGGGNGTTDASSEFDPMSVTAAAAPALSTVDEPKRNSMRHASIFHHIRTSSDNSVGGIVHNAARRVSLQHHTAKHQVDTVVTDRIAAVVYQVCDGALVSLLFYFPRAILSSPSHSFPTRQVVVYFTVLYAVEPILQRAYYSPAVGASTINWCPSITSGDAWGGSQALMDAIN